MPTGKGGLYLCTANIRLDYSSAGYDGEVAIAAWYVNGSAKTRIFQLSMGNGGRHMGVFAGSGSTIFNLSAGDYVEIYGYMQDDSASGSLKVHGSAGGDAASYVGFMRIN